MKCSLVVLAVAAVLGASRAQFQSFYAGGGVNYPRPVNSGGDQAGLNNRFGAEAGAAAPTDANGHDLKQVAEAAAAPHVQKPFWYLNRDHIRQHIGLSATAPATATAAAAAAAVQPAPNLLQQNLPTKAQAAKA